MLDPSQQTSEQEEHAIPPYQLASGRAPQDCEHSPSVPEYSLSTYSTLDGALSSAVTSTQSQDQVVPLDAPSYQLASGGAQRGDRGPDRDQFLFFMETNPQDHDARFNASDYHWQSPGVPKESLSTYSTLDGAVDGALLLGYTPTQPKDPLDARPNEPTTPNPLCPTCTATFPRVQERNRHIETHLPHSIYCSFIDCSWTGRRQCDLKEHWGRKHPKTGQVPSEDENRIYDPTYFVKLILDGRPVRDVARYAFAKAQDRLSILCKLHVGANVLGRNRDLKEWIHAPPSQLN